MTCLGWASPALFALLVAACAAGAPPGVGGVPGLAVSARVADADVTRLEVEMTLRSARYRIDRVELRGPSGAATPAVIRREAGGQEPGFRRPRVGIDMAGGSDGHLDVGVGLRLGALGGPARPRRLHVTLPVPDPAAYRRDPGAWRINLVVLGPGGQVRVITVPAPPP